jgi:NTE family protein
MTLLNRALDPNNLRPLFDATAIVADMVKGIREDAGFLGRTRRALFPLPFDRPLPIDIDPFGRRGEHRLKKLEGKRVAVVASGGSGATAAALGVLRALEEAHIHPVAISAASGAVLFTLPWACGVEAADVARFWLELTQADYVDPDWRMLLRSGTRAFGGWAGLLKGTAVERSTRNWLGVTKLGQTQTRFSTVAWNVDLNRVETFGTVETPRIEVARTMHMAIAIPIFVEPVRVRDHLFADGGIVDIFPVRPVLAAHPDVVIGVNAYLPENFTGEDVTGWRSRSFAVLRASSQLRWSGMVTLAREQALLVKDKLRLLHPVPYEEVRGARFYETFFDRTRWPKFMRDGREAARSAFS